MCALKLGQWEAIWMRGGGIKTSNDIGGANASNDFEKTKTIYQEQYNGLALTKNS